MRNVLYSILLCTGICTLISACSNGDYSANPSSPSNSSVNPLKPLTADQYTWNDAAKGQVVATINGTRWVSDSAGFGISGAGTNRITAIKHIPGDSTHHWQQIDFYFTNTWAGNVYNMGYHQYNTSAIYYPKYNGIDSLSFSSLFQYNSALGNSGGMYLEEFDSAYYRGKFYFQAVNSTGDIQNFTEGSFNVIRQ